MGNSKLRYLFQFLIATVVVISCNAYDLPKGTPQCIEDKIAGFDKNHNCPDIRVEQYSYQGAKYYCFVEDCCCDIGSQWYDEDCNPVCITGTFGGTVDCSIPLDSLAFDAVIWKN